MPVDQGRRMNTLRGKMSKWTLLMLLGLTLTCFSILLLNVLVFLRQGGYANEEYSSSHTNEDFSEAATSLSAFGVIMEKMDKNAALQQYDQKSLTCELRAYDPTWYYNMNTTNPPSFLRDTKYLFGKWPIMLSHSAEYEHAKICIDRIDWPPEADQPKDNQHSDGTNPSVLSIARLKEGAPLVAANILHHHPNTTFLAAVTNKMFPQCVYNRTPRLSGYDNQHTLLLLLDEQMKTVAQTTLHVLVDRAWGLNEPSTGSNPPLEQIITILDAPRLFVYQRQVQVSFISRDWGWTDQYYTSVHIDFVHPHHFHQNGDSRQSKFWATLWASEVVTLGKGQNQAILYDPDVSYSSEQAKREPSPSMFSVSQVDPVTVSSIGDTRPLEHKKQRRRGLRENNKEGKGLTAFSTVHTWETTKAHGTNGMMIRLPSTQKGQPADYLGVAHFHRPENTGANTYAQFGHHYTHFFYTIRRKSMSSTDFQLTAMSAEFVLPSIDSSGKDPKEEGWAMDAHIIQFISGIEFLADTNELVIAYGINNCEAAVTAMPLQHVRDMLVPVATGQEIGDFMQPLLYFPNGPNINYSVNHNPKGVPQDHLEGDNAILPSEPTEERIMGDFTEHLRRGGLVASNHVWNDILTNCTKVVRYEGTNGTTQLAQQIFDGEVCQKMVGSTHVEQAVQETTFSDPSCNIFVNITFDCMDLFENSEFGTGNFVFLFYALRLAARTMGNADVLIQCNDALDVAKDLILPWVMGFFPRTLHALPLSLRRPPRLEKTCGHYTKLPVGHMAAEMRYHFRKMAIALVGIPYPGHPAEAWAKKYLWGNNHIYMGQNSVMQMANPQQEDNPLHSNVELDDAVLHFRCGDYMTTDSQSVGFMKFESFSRHLDANVKSIGIATNPFGSTSQSRNLDNDSVAVTRCKKVVFGFVDHLKSKFPNAQITIRNGANDSMALTLARMVMAKQLVVGITTFSLFPAVASFGHSYIKKPDHEFAANTWMMGDEETPPVEEIFPNVHIVEEPNILTSAVKTLWGQDDGDTVLKWFQQYNMDVPLAEKY
ncbi:expressed unknown protein [Seminavis robusta]|uniref:Uncharacterized protein n=1 Tax=Seminavis robusta TaxID=568900 RepID=A0A9N8HHD8_9STRA|nr:expressed unknown protein [Seminavis robusta]|eukprot:Sro531_g161350.1 n/a (1046) ;mRNA; r:36910-40136